MLRPMTTKRYSGSLPFELRGNESLRERRVKAGLSVEALAVATKSSASAIRYWEEQSKLPKNPLIRRLYLRAIKAIA